MVNISDLKAGDVIRVVDEWNSESGENKGGEMDTYLGQLLTVKAVFGDPASWSIRPYVRVEEDHGRWFWYDAAIAEVVTSDVDEHECEEYDVGALFDL